MSIGLSVGSVPADILELKARRYLAEHYKEFRDAADTLYVTVEVNLNNSRRRVAVIYYKAGVGEPYWAVTFNDDAEISHHESGIVSCGTR